MGSNHFRLDMPRLVEFYMRGKLHLEDWISAKLKWLRHSPSVMPGLDLDIHLSSQERSRCWRWIAGSSPRVSGTVCAYHAASLIVTDARASRRRCAALVAYGPKSKLGCCGSGVGGGLSSSAIGRRCMRLARMSRAKASWLSTILLASWARRSNKKAISATAIWMRTAFSEVPKK